MSKQRVDLELMYDKLLMIKTQGIDNSDSDFINYPYEPTPYSVLERLAESGYIRKKNTVIDYGCGKGRVDFFLSYQTRCKSIGVEYNERIYQAAVRNMESCVSSGRVSLVNENAADYKVPLEADRCFFFNPFSIEILRKAMARILDSYYEDPREMYLFFYYPSEEYISYLMTQELLMFEDEIDCKDLFDGEDPRERIMIFSVGY